MTKIFSKKAWIIFASILTITGFVYACADGDWDDSQTSNFTPQAFLDSNNTPFFYSLYSNYGDPDLVENPGTRFKEANTNDWFIYLDEKIPKATISKLLYQEGANTIDSISLPLKETGGKKLQQFIIYLRIARQAETFANTEMKYWANEEPIAPVKFNYAKFNAFLLESFNTQNDLYLKERYWFQLVRSYYFSKGNCVDFFDKTQALFPKNILYYRTQAYVAGSLYNRKEYSKANYIYSQIYNQCNELKTVAHYSFHPQEEKDWMATLNLCKNDEEKITLWQMLGIYYHDEVRSIKEIYKLNPKSDKLNLLVARGINKTELQLVEYAANDSVFNKNLFNLVVTIANANNTNKNYLWYEAAGYLSFLNKKYKQADAFLSKAQKIIPDNDLSIAQLRLLKLINKIGAANKIKSRFENEIVADLDWLFNLKFDQIHNFRYTYAITWIRTTMAEKYRHQNEMVKAECFNNFKQFYGDPKLVESLKIFLEKPNKTPYEKTCSNAYTFNLININYYQGIRLAYTDKLAEAIEKTKASGILSETVLPGNPFNGRINDCHDCDWEAPQKIKYTILSLLEKLNNMESQIKAGKDVYRNSLLVGNVFYNISFYGNSRTFYQCGITEGYESSASYIDSTFKVFELNMELAKQYYTTALSASTTDEQKAQINYLLAKCQRNEWYNTRYFIGKNLIDSDSDETNFIGWSGFKALQGLSKTKYYKEVLNECGYFRSYVQSAASKK